MSGRMDAGKLFVAAPHRLLDRRGRSTKNRAISA